MDTRVEDIREKATRVKRIATRHRGSGGLENFCNHCFELWPCDTAYLLAQLAAKEKTIEALREVTKEAGCNLPNEDGSRCGDCGNCRTTRILK
ncbi:hypothetical protein LCGC14_2514130, partial [marine sediment metagenome]